MSQWLIIGISGVTCGGKSSLASALQNFFTSNRNVRILATNVVIGDTVLINQDSYFLPESDERHQWIKELNHINWEILTSLDMEKMLSDIQNILKDDFTPYKKNFFDTEPTFQKQQKVNILIVEGFLIFNQPQLLKLCQLKFHLHLPYEKCFERRKVRVYNPPDVIGYFEMCVWPMYEKHFWEVNDHEDILILNGELPKERIFNYVLEYITKFL